MENIRGKLSIKCHLCYLSVFVWLIIGFTVSCDREVVVPANSSHTTGAATGEMVTVDFTVTSSPTLRSRLNSPLSGELERAYKGGLYIRATLSENTNPVSLRSMTLDAGTKIRVITYTISAGDTTIVAYADYEIGNGGDNFLIPISAPILLPSGSYKFVAYSYNDTNTMPAIADTTAAVPSADLIWGEADENISPGNTTVHIQMEHLFSQIMLHAELDPLLGNTIYGIDVARFEHTFPKLVVRSKILIPDVIGQIPFEQDPGSGYSNVWNSIYHPVFTNGGAPVVTIDSVTIDATTYYGPFPIAYTTSLDAGKEYTLNVTFAAQSLSVSTNSLVFAKCLSGSGVEQFVTVSTNVPSGWNYSISGVHASDFTVSRSGNTLTVYPNANPCCAPRSATITVSAGILTETISLTQEPQIWIYNNTGNYTLNTTCSGMYRIELWGAGSRYTVGGGYVKGEVYVGAAQDLHLNIGGQGLSGQPSGNIIPGGFNGGGNAFNYNGDTNSGSGGGATDIRFGGTGLNNRIMVAGGAGGFVGAESHVFGAGGGLLGDNCSILHVGTTYTAYGGTQTAGGLSSGSYAINGSFGQGGNGGTASVNAGHQTNNAVSHRAGGGGGYYGGGHNVLSGGGGSSFISGHPGCNAVNASGVHTGQPNHFSGLTFTNTVMIDGAGRGWTNVVGGLTPMPNPGGGFYASGVGNIGNGFAIITYLGP